MKLFPLHEALSHLHSFTEILPSASLTLADLLPQSLFPSLSKLSQASLSHTRKPTLTSPLLPSHTHLQVLLMGDDLFTQVR